MSTTEERVKSADVTVELTEGLKETTETEAPQNIKLAEKSASVVVARSIKDTPTPVETKAEVVEKKVEEVVVNSYEGSATRSKAEICIGRTDSLSRRYLPLRVR